jgi:hypothetical protein
VALCRGQGAQARRKPGEQDRRANSLVLRAGALLAVHGGVLLGEAGLGLTDPRVRNRDRGRIHSCSRRRRARHRFGDRLRPSGDSLLGLRSRHQAACLRRIGCIHRRGLTC